MDDNTILQMLHEGFKYEESDKFETKYPDDIYDIKQAKGYNESTCSQANMGIEFKVATPRPTLMPPDHPTHNLTWTKIWPATNDKNYIEHQNKDVTTTCKQWDSHDSPYSEHNIVATLQRAS